MSIFRSQDTSLESSKAFYRENGLPLQGGPELGITTSQDIFNYNKNRLPFGSTQNLYGYFSWLYVDICIVIGVGIVVDVGICIGVCVGVGIGIGVGIGSVSQHLASCGIWAGSIWQHLGSSVTSGIIWQHLEAPGSIWRHLTASKLAASGGIWDPPAASGSIWGI